MSGGGGGSGAGEEGEYAVARTSVWWDIENCPVPRGCDPHAIAQNIREALSDAGYRGRVSVSAFGDTYKIPKSVQHALSSTGISLNHVPAGVKDASDKKILVDMLFWAVDNPPPANYLLISGDRDFSNALHQLRMRRYNILLAHSPNVSQALVAAAKCVWLWTSLVTGGPSLKCSEYSQLCCTVNVNASGADLAKYSVTEMKRTVDPSSERFPKNNQKTFVNGKSDNQNKAKQSWKSVNQFTSRSSSSELKQLSSTQDVLVRESTNTPIVVESEQQKHVQLDPETATTGSSVINTPSSTVVASLPETSLSFSFSNNTMHSNANQLKEAPHKFFGHGLPTVSGPSQSNNLSHPDFFLQKNSAGNNDYLAHHSQTLRPSLFLPEQPNIESGNSYAPNSMMHGSHLQQPNFVVPPFSSTPENIPDMSKLDISNATNVDAHMKNHFYPRKPETKPGIALNSSGSSRSYISHGIMLPQHSGMHTMNHLYGPEECSLPAGSAQITVNDVASSSEFPQPSEEALFHIGHILNALYFLKTDMMLPTEENITDCIKYRIGLPQFSVSMGLDYALKHHMVVKSLLGKKLPCYTGKNDRIWNCVNIMDINAKHPKSTWDKVQGFLSSPEGHSKMFSSHCRYHAAILIKCSCLEELPLGMVLQILNLIVTSKKWLIPHSSGWQPLFIGPQLKA